jgi:hypothetical protein
MTTIQVHLPDDLARGISKLTDNTETFIIDLLRFRIQEATLADEYRLAGSESKELSRDFASVDLEGWEDEY